MRYIARPVEVEAHIISAVAGITEHGCWVTLDDGTTQHCDHGMIARYIPKPGDYWVKQADGYVYLNPKDVFERKYERAVK